MPNWVCSLNRSTHLKQFCNFKEMNKIILLFIVFVCCGTIAQSQQGNSSSTLIKIFNQNSRPYEYLIKSIDDFNSQGAITDKLLASGFKNVSFKNIFGGIASIHYAWKLND